MILKSSKRISPLFLFCVLFVFVQTFTQAQFVQHGAARITRTVKTSHGDSLATAAVDTLDGKTLQRPASSNDDMSLPLSYDKDLEQLIKTWHAGYTKKRNSHVSSLPKNHNIPDSVYVQRLSKLPTAIPLTYNVWVKDAIEMFLYKRSGLISSVLTIGDLYFPLMDQIFDRYQLPIELKYLTIIESGLNPVAVSPAGAAGLWQFMLPTGKIYGLDINSLVDERMSLSQSTEAAAKYLRDMYNIYGDWLLVIAAYNCGPGRVNSAIRRAGGSRDFWKLYPYLPRETRRYVPLFIGAYYAMSYHKEHQIGSYEVGTPIATDTIMVNKSLTFDRVHELSGVSHEDIRILNPQYKRKVIPGNVKPYPLRLPVGAVFMLDAKRDSLFSERSVVSVDMAGADKTSDFGMSTSSTKYYRVRKGDTLGKIAKKHHMTVGTLKRLNGLKSNKLRVGQRLIVRT
ncbi:Membrane-bound lytic murein transglycosylase D precursor [Porphyromonas macacae]|uniref:Membrane-bound lytic murein transglycosylase D n=1 Tax=Porphyromonas macacae TaxID=28115 RepID=A0A379DJI6_9PORP|nr:Membrane-bound lytic murein transglycosylase D precursor [Porphyromonas macacae]